MALAAVLTALAIWQLWGPFDQRTDIVGYNAWAAFNIENWIRGYYLAVGFFPLAALLIFLGLTRIGPRLGLAPPPPQGPLRAVTPAPAQGPALAAAPLANASSAKRRAIAAARIGFAGLLLGLEVGIVADSIWLWLPLGTAIYAAAVLLAAAALGRWGGGGRGFEARLALANSVGGPLAVAGLVAVSATTQVEVVKDSTIHHYHWFPAWLGLPLAAVAGGFVVRAGRRTESLGAAQALERGSLLLLTAPLAIFLLVSHFYGPPPGVDTFHSGEQLVGSRLISDGWFPWRDVVLTHGLLSDAFNPLPGFAIFEHSRWGAVMGVTVLLHPLYLVSVYLLCVYLFGRNWLFLLLIGLLSVGTLLGPEQEALAAVDFRFIFWPLILIFLAATLDHPSASRAAGLGLASVGQTILVPEAAPALIAVGVVVVLYEWYGRRPGDPVTVTFQRTIWFYLASLALAAAFLGYLAANGALDDFVYVNRQLLAEHSLASSLPVTPYGYLGLLFYFAAIAPLVSMLICVAYAVVRLRQRRGFRTDEWVMGAVAIFLFFYYPKFLYRMDGGHLFQTYGVALPLVLYVAYRLIDPLEQMLSRWVARRRIPWPTAHPLSLVLVILVTVLAWSSLSDRVSDAPASFRGKSWGEPKFARLGYSAYFDMSMYRDLHHVIDAYLKPGDRLYDFSNEPALFFYLIDRDPAIRYFHASLELNAELQQNAIDELKRARPKMIIYDDTIVIGLSNWDGIPTMVRNYLMSRWILDHYRPLLTTHSHTIYVRRDMPPLAKVNPKLELKPIVHGLPFQTQQCNWGKAPNFLSGPGEPSPGAKGAGARARPPGRPTLTIVGWAGDPKAKLPAREVIAVDGGRVVGRARPHIDRPDVVAYGLPSGFERSGFSIQIPAAKLGSPGGLHVYGVSRSGGELTELVPQGGTPAKGEVQVGGRSVAITPSAVYGQINQRVRPPQMEVSPPAGTRWTDYRWLELDAGPKGFRDGDVALYDRQSRPSPQREITFKTMAGKGRRYIVPVDNCAQWHGYRGRHLYLDFFPRQDVSAVRLIR